MKTILLAVAAMALLQDPAKTGGKVAWGSDPAAAEKRARLEHRAVFLYFTDGGMPCKALDAGAFSSGDMVTVCRRVLPVLLECPDDKAHADLRARLKITAFPSLVILEPDGKTQELTARETADLAAELTKVARRFPGRDVLWLSSIEAALAKAKDEPRPVAVYLHVAEEDLASAQDRLLKLATQGRLDKFIWVELAATTDEKDPLKAEYDIETLPAIAFLDPRYSPPRQFGIYDLKEKAKSKDVQDKLDERLKKYKDTKVKK
jgi:hypothetical protein